jgi:hypothetical protein
MKDVYAVAGITKQAHFKECRSQALLNHRIQELVVNVDILRKAHPGCGLEKMYRTLKPDFIGRDKFIEIMMSLGYRVKQNKNYKRTTYAGLINFPNLITGCCCGVKISCGKATLLISKLAVDSII